jgi:hypothetical protein
MIMKTTIAQKIRLAKAFGYLMQAELSRADFTQMIALNKAMPEHSNICHSHDFCDANMVMLDAFKEVFGRDPVFLSESEDMTESEIFWLTREMERDTELWNEAWTIAVAADFFE